MAAFEEIDINSEAFALRLANLMVATRTHQGLGVGQMAKRSGGRFSKRDLKEFEAASRPLDEMTVDELAQLYQCDLGLILPLRLPVVISANRISAGGVHEEYVTSDPDAVLTAYLTLVRQLRRQRRHPVVDLRRDDVEVLSGFLQDSNENVVHRLATLMHATQTKRTAMVGVLATGAVVVGLVGTVAAIGVTGNTGDSGLNSSVTSVDTTVPTSDTQVVTTDTVGVTEPSTTVAVTDPPTTVPVTEPVTVPVTVPPTTQAPVTTAPKPPVTQPAPTTSVASIETNLPTTSVTIVDPGGPPLPPIPAP